MALPGEATPVPIWGYVDCTANPASPPALTRPGGPTLAYNQTETVSITLHNNLSVATGLLLLSPRIVATSSNYIFQLKMLILGAAAAFHFAIYQGAARGTSQRVPPGVAGALGLTLWFGMVLAGCAFLLIE